MEPTTAPLRPNAVTHTLPPRPASGAGHGPAEAQLPELSPAEETLITVLLKKGL